MGGNLKLLLGIPGEDGMYWKGGDCEAVGRAWRRECVRLQAELGCG